MLCDTCDKPTLSSAYQPANIYRHQGRICLVVCGDCEEDIKADNVRTVDSFGSRMLNAAVSRHDGAPRHCEQVPAFLTGDHHGPLSGSFLGAWF